MCDILKKEFKLQNVGFRHSYARAFFTAQWEWHPYVFLVYRVVAAVYSVGCFLAVTISSIWSNGVHSIMVYLTIWTYLILCLYLLVSAAIAVFYWSQGRATPGNTSNAAVIIKARIVDSKAVTLNGVVSPAFEEDADMANKQHMKGEQFRAAKTTRIDIQTGDHDQKSSKPINTDHINWCIALSWMLSDVIHSFAIVVSVIYFVALFPSIGVQKGFIHDLNMHAFNSVLVLIDVAIAAKPVRLLHVLYPIVYGSCYIIFSVVYWSMDKGVNVLYPGVLDWNYPGFTCGLVAVMSIIVLPLIQLGHFGLFRLRLLIYRSVYGVEYFEND